jgi:hypothetical protein
MGHQHHYQLLPYMDSVPKIEGHAAPAFALGGAVPNTSSIDPYPLRLGHAIGHVTPPTSFQQAPSTPYRISPLFIPFEEEITVLKSFKVASSGKLLDSTAIAVC